MKDILNKWSSILSKIFAIGAGTSLFTVFMIIFINSTRRYLVGKSFEWGEQLPVFMAIYGVMFGMAWAYLNDQHVKFTILVGFIPKKFANILYMLVDLIMVVTGSIFIYSGYLFAMKRGGIEASGMINISRDLKELTGIDNLLILGEMYPYQISMAIGGGMLTIAALVRFLIRITEIQENEIIKAV